jgi:type IV pilus assembly protein PilE
MPGRHKGFTLIELMLVLVVLAVILTIALPSYQGVTRKSQRAAAQSALLDLANRQEQYFLNNKTYTGTLANLGRPASYYVDSRGQQTAAAADAVYQLSITVPEPPLGYSLTATALNDQAEDGCGNYTLTSAGVRTVTGPTPAAQCW